MVSVRTTYRKGSEGRGGDNAGGRTKSRRWRRVREQDSGYTGTIKIIWTRYFKYRVKLRGFEMSKIENILRDMTERYFDTVTQRAVAVGMHDNILILIPYEQQAG